MKQKMRGKRFLAALLALILAFTSMNFNAAAYADEIEETTEVDEETLASEIPGSVYDVSLNEEAVNPDEQTEEAQEEGGLADEDLPVAEDFDSEDLSGLMLNSSVTFVKGFEGEIFDKLSNPEGYDVKAYAYANSKFYFALVLNDNKEGFTAESKLTDVTNLADLKVEKKSGENWVAASEASLKKISGNVFSFSAPEGEYRIKDTKAANYGISSVEIEVLGSKAGFYALVPTVSGNGEVDVPTRVADEYTLTYREAYENVFYLVYYVPTEEGFEAESCTAYYGDELIDNSEEGYYLLPYPELTNKEFPGTFYIIEIIGEEVDVPVLAKDSLTVKVNSTSGTISETIKIKPFVLDTDKIAVSGCEYPYVGKVASEELLSGLFSEDDHITYDGMPFKWAYDGHTWKLTNKGKGVAVGKYAATLTGVGNFVGSKDFEYEIIPFNFNKLEPSDFVDGYYNSEIYGYLNPETGKFDYYFSIPTASNNFGYSSIVLGRDCDVEYGYLYDGGPETYYPAKENGPITIADFSGENALNINGTYYAKLTGKGNYTGTCYVAYRYHQQEFNKGLLVGTDEPQLVYSGNSYKESKDIPIVLKDGKYTLVEGQDYTLEFKEKNNAWTIDWTNVTDYKSEDSPVIVVTGIGVYAGGSFSIYPMINPKDLSKFAVKRIVGEDEVALPATVAFSDVKENGFDIALYYNGTKLVKDTDYTLSFIPEIGKQSLTIKGINNFKGTINKTVTINADTVLTSKNLKLAKAISAVTYTGQEQKPELELKLGTAVLAPENYTVTYSNNINAGTATATVTGNIEKGYSGTVKFTFKINKATIGKQGDGKANVWLSDDNTTGSYSPKGAKANIVLDDISGGDNGDYETLVEGTDYKVTYKDNKAITTDTKKASYTITGIGNYQGTLTGKFDIVPASINNPELFAECVDEYISDSNNANLLYATPEFKLIDNGVVLKAGVDYTAEPKENYGDVSMNNDPADKTGKTLRFLGGKDGGNTYTVIFTGKGNYADSFEFSFNVKDDARIDFGNPANNIVAEFDDNPSWDWDDLPYTFSPYNDPAKVSVYADAGETKLSEDTDYIVSYSDCYNAGTVYVTITGIGKYCGTISLDYEIMPLEVTELKELYYWGNTNSVGPVFISLNRYEGDPFAAYIDNKGKLQYLPFWLGIPEGDGGAIELIEKTDYTYKLINPKAEHGAPVIAEFTFKGNYTGKIQVNLGLVYGTALYGDPECFMVSGIKDLNYTGKNLTQKITVKDLEDNVTFKQGKDLEVTYYKRIEGDGYAPDWDHPLSSVTDAGVYYVTYKIVGKYVLENYYSPEAEIFAIDAAGEPITFEVKPASLAKATVKLTKTSFEYNYNDVSAGDGYEAGVTSVKLGKKTLEAGVDYTVSYENNKKPGTAVAIITGIGNYEGSTANKSYTISGKTAIANADVVVASSALYSPAGAFPEVTVSINGQQLIYNQDYTLSATDNKKLYSETGKISYLTIKGKGQYTGSIEKKYPFKVVKGDLDDLFMNGHATFGAAKEVSVMGSSGYLMGSKFNGKAVKPDPKVKVDGKALKLGKDYTVRYLPLGTDYYSDSISDVGIYMIEVTGIGNYAGTIESTQCVYIMLYGDASKFTVKTANREYSATGIYNSVVSVKYGKQTLVEGVDYEVCYDVPLMGVELTNPSISMYADPLGITCYDPEPREDWLGFMSKYNRPYLEESDWPDVNISAGKTAAYILGIGNYSGVKIAPYTIKGYDISKAKLDPMSFNLNILSGESSEPVISGTYKVDKKTTIPVTYRDAELVSVNGLDLNTMHSEEELIRVLKKGSKNTAVVKGIGRFSGTAKVKVTFSPQPINSSNVEVIVNPNSIYDYMDGYDKTCVPMVYNPAGVKPYDYDVYVALKQNGEIFEALSLYEIIEELDMKSFIKVTYSNNKAVGSKESKKAPKMTLSGAPGMLYFDGSVSGTFDIEAADVAEYAYVSAPDVNSALDKNGFVKTYKSAPIVKYVNIYGLTYCISNTKLKADKDYTVTYSYAADTKVFDGKNYVIRKAGTVIGDKDKLLPGTSIRVTVKGKGNYCGYNDMAVYKVGAK